jgi:hypothetical protein
MSTTPAPTPAAAAPQFIQGKIIEAENKVAVSAARPLPLACGLYAIETSGGVWLCAYYGQNRSVFDYLPQKGAALNEVTAGITFHVRQFVPTEQYGPAVWEEFKKARFMGFEEH